MARPPYVGCGMIAEGGTGADPPYKAKMLVPGPESRVPRFSRFSRLSVRMTKRHHDGGKREAEKRGEVGCPLNYCHDLLADEDKGESDRQMAKNRREPGRRPALFRNLDLRLALKGQAKRQENA